MSWSPTLFLSALHPLTIDPIQHPDEVGTIFILIFTEEET